MLARRLTLLIIAMFYGVCILANPAVSRGYRTRTTTRPQRPGRGGGVESGWAPGRLGQFRPNAESSRTHVSTVPQHPETAAGCRDRFPAMYGSGVNTE